MAIYLIKSALCLALFLAFYHLVLEREKMHIFNRFYLLGSVLFSFLAPLYIIYINVPFVLETSTIQEGGLANTAHLEVDTPINYWFYFRVFYVFIASLFLIRFGKNLYSIFRKININKKIKIEKATLVLVEDKIAPHTFWNYIFFNKDEYFNEKLESELYTHELTHATQKHTLDVLLIELLQIVFWINPIIYLLKKAVKLNHEFLADNKVINTYKNITAYQYLLLNKSHKNEYYLASNLNYLLTKKRLQMMTKETSKGVLWLKKLAIIPLIIGAIFLFAERVEAQEVANKKELIEYNTLAKKYNTSNKQRVYLKDVKRLEYLYAKMNAIQKKNAEPFPNFPPPPPPPPIVKKGEKSNIPPPPPPPSNVKTGFKKINGITVYYVTYGSVKKYYNKYGKRVNENGKEISKKKANSREIIPGQNISKIYKDGKVFCSFINIGVKKSKKSIIPPLPPPNSKESNLEEIEEIIETPISSTEVIEEVEEIKETSENIEVVEEVREPTKKGFIQVGNQTIFYVKKDGKIEYFNRWGSLVDEKGKILNSKDKSKKDSKDKTIKINSLDGKSSFSIDEEKITYYLDGKVITKEEMEKIHPNDIKTINVKKEKDSTGSVYIISK